MLGQKLLESKKDFAEAWNFGPYQEGNLRVEDVVRQLQKHWQKIKFTISAEPSDLREAGLLKLDCSKAHLTLGWLPVWDSQTTLDMTCQWYRHYYEWGEVISKQ